MARTSQAVVKVVLPLLILASAGGITYKLFASREDPGRQEAETTAALVETRTVQRTAHRLDVRASGTVVPARRVAIQPQVSGRIVDLHPQLVPGGLIEEGSRVIQIDRSDYQLAVDQRKTALQQAQAQLEIEKGRQEVAQREWKLFKQEAEKLATDKKLKSSSLALRKPQLTSAKAQVDAARAQLESARLNLRRTSVEAPFDAIVLEESAAVGQLAGAQSQIATLVGTDRFWVRLSVGTDKIEHIDIPGVNAETGSTATIRYEVGERSVEREARVKRLLGDLDPAGRMARILVQIDDPLGLEGADEQPDRVRGVPLLIDSYVDVRIEGNAERELIELSRDAVRNGDEVYLLREGKLAVEKLEIVWRRPDSVLVDAGVSDGDTVVVGPLPSPVEGMPLKAANQETSESGESGAENGESGSESEGEEGQ